MDLISRRYHIMIINMLNNYSTKYSSHNIIKFVGIRYSSHYIIKFVSFIPIYYAINFDIVFSFMLFSNLDLSIYILQVQIKKLIFLSK